MTKEIEEILEHQAGMESLWLIEPTIGEALLQAALRHLTAALRGESVIAKINKDMYWHCDDELHSAQESGK